MPFQELTLITLNIYEGGLDDWTSADTAHSSPRVHRISSYLKISVPDCVALLELNHWDESILSARAKGWGHNHSVIMETTNTQFRLGFTSRYPIKVLDKINDGFWHGMLVVQICPGNGSTASSKSLNVIVTHLNPMSTLARLEEAKRITSYIGSHLGSWIVTGDLNSLSPHDAWYYSITGALSKFQGDEKLKRKFLGRDGAIDYAVMQRLHDIGLADLGPLFQDKEKNNFSHSVPTKYAVDDMHAVEMRLDYILATRDLLDKVQECRVMKDEVTGELSDHYPVFLRLKYD